jgi:hypothetical protein
MEVCLYTASGALVAGNDDSGVIDEGSTSPLDPYLSHGFAAPGTYVIGVRETGENCILDGYGWSVLPEGATYELQISLSQHQSNGTDSDEDGVPDDADCDLSSDLSPTVVLAGCNSGVSNRMVSDGCTIADLIVACADDAKNHGKFSSCVAAITNDLERNGKISDSGKLMIQSCAAQTDIGR